MDMHAILKLSVSPRGRKNVAHGYLEDAEEFFLQTPDRNAKRAFAREVEEASLGEVRAAVPFVWELVPGTPKGDLDSVIVDVGRESSNETEETRSQDQASPGSSEGSEAMENFGQDSSMKEFEFSSRFEAFVEPLPWHGACAPYISTAEELCSGGQVSPLPLPPRLQTAKHTENSDSASPVRSGGGFFKSYHYPHSPRSPRSLLLCRLTKTLNGEMSVLGIQERKPTSRSFSPLRLFNQENPAADSSISSKAFSSSESASSVSSSSASTWGGETNADLPQSLWEQNQSSTLKDLLFTDMAIASAGIGNSKLSSSKSRIVESKSELLKKDMARRNQRADASEVESGRRGEPALTPQLSRSNARSRSVPTPALIPSCSIGATLDFLLFLRIS